MSYDIYLNDPKTGSTIELREIHGINGGTMVMGGTGECWLNVTYNYGKHYYRVLGEKGIRTIYGLTGEASIPVLESAISQLGDERSADYWEPTEGNAKSALVGLLTFAKAAPHGVWAGD